jgi:sugar phosphate permease
VNREGTTVRPTKKLESIGSELTRSQRRWRWRIFGITWLAYAGFYLCRRNFSVAMPLLETELGYSNMQLANVIFGYSVLYALGQFCFGSLTDRFGSRVVVSAGLFLAILSNVLMGLLPTLAALTVLSCANGLGQSAGWPGLVNNMAPWFRRRERGVVMGWWTTNYVIGGFLAVLFAAFALTHRTWLAGWGWRRGFWLPALLLSVIAAAFALLTRNRPEDAKLPPIADQKEAALAPACPSAPIRAPFLRVITDLEVWVVAMGAVFSKVIRYSFLYWLPVYMTQRLHYSTGQAGYTASLYEFAGFGGALVAGYVSDRFMKARRLPVAAFMFWGLALMCWIHPQLAASGHLGLALSIALIGVMNYGPDTLLQGAASQDIGARLGVGTTSGFISGFGSFGQLFSPYLVAYVAEKYGWDNLFYSFVVISALAGVLLATQWRRESGLAGVRQTPAAA